MKIIRKNTQSAICPSDYIYPNTPRTLGYTMVICAELGKLRIQCTALVKNYFILCYESAILENFTPLLLKIQSTKFKKFLYGALLGPYVFSKKI